MEFKVNHVCNYLGLRIPILNVHFPCIFFVPQVKRFLEHVNRHLPNVSKNLFILFNLWDLVVDEGEDSSNDDSDDDEDTSRRDATVETVKKQHLQKVQEFLVQGLQANAVLDRTFFVSGKEACKVQENEKKGKPCSESGIFIHSRPVVCTVSTNLICYILSVHMYVICNYTRLHHASKESCTQLLKVLI